MARIRTLKPDFFTSPNTAAVDFPVRIFYQALWCAADDFGVGETNFNSLLGLAFPDDDGFTAQDVRRFCADCAQHYGTIFYEVRGRCYYAIPTWEKHQKLERRGERRKYPGPDDPDAIPDLRISTAPELPSKTGAESGGIGAGTGEQGNRGNQSGYGTEVCHQSADDVPPPDRCPKHENTPVPPSCPGCGDARRFLTAWKQKREKAAADELEQQRAKKAIANRAMRDCRLCDDDGWILGEDGTPVEPAAKCTAHQETRHA